MKDACFKEEGFLRETIGFLKQSNASIALKRNSAWCIIYYIA